MSVSYQCFTRRASKNFGLAHFKIGLNHLLLPSCPGLSQYGSLNDFHVIGIVSNPRYWRFLDAMADRELAELSFDGSRV